MMAGAEGAAGVDADIGQFRIVGWPVAGRMDVEAAGAQRFEPAGPDADIEREIEQVRNYLQSLEAQRRGGQQ